MPVMKLARTRVTLFTTYRNQVAMNVLHYCPALDDFRTFDQTDLQNFVDTLQPMLTTDFRACLSQEASYLGMQARYLGAFPSEDLIATNTVGAGIGTAAAAGTEPSQVCGLLRKRSGFPGRNKQGRFYMPFVPRGAAGNDDLLTNAYKTLLTALASQLSDFVVVDPFGAAETIFHPCLQSHVRSSVPVYLETVTVADGFATQRRRGFFGRPNAVPF